MIHDILTIMWKEMKELFRLRGTLRGSTVGVLVFLFVFGIFLPLQLGKGWVEQPMVLVLWLWVPLFLVSSVVADSFAGERERQTLETLLASRLSDTAILFGKIGAAVAYGWGLTLISLLMGCAAVNIAHGKGEFLFYTPVMSVGIFLWSLLAAGLTACVGVIISLKATTVRQAQQILSISIMMLLFIPIFGFNALPAELKDYIKEFFQGVSVTGMVSIVTGVLAAFNLLFLVLAMKRFRRARLILD